MLGLRRWATASSLGCRSSESLGDPMQRPLQTPVFIAVAGSAASLGWDGGAGQFKRWSGQEVVEEVDKEIG